MTRPQRKKLADSEGGRIIKNYDLADFTLLETVYSPNYEMPRHTHSLAHFSFVLQGGYVERSDGKTRAGKPSTLIVRSPEESHSVKFSNTGARIFGLIIKPDWMRRFQSGARRLDGTTDFDGDSAARLARRIYLEFRIMDEASPLAVEGLSLEIFAEASRRRQKQLKSSPPWLRVVKEFLHENFAVCPKINEIAAMVGVHPVHLSRAFRQKFHCTMSEYVRRLRIEAACVEILKSETPLSQIALNHGFYDQSHFTNHFKQIVGMTPAQYKTVFRPR